MIVWDQGTWEPHATDDPPPRSPPATSTRTSAGRSWRGRDPGAPGRGDSGKDQWLLLHKHDDFAVEGWDPEDHPRSVLSGRTNDEVKADPHRMWRGDLPPAQASIAIGDAAPSGPDPAELDALGALPGARAARGRSFGRRLKVTNLDKAIFPGRDGEEPITKREFIGYRPIAPPCCPTSRAGPST